MERSVTDESVTGPHGGRRGDTGSADVSVAVAEPPASLSGAHWANRDNDTLYRRPGHSGTFRRPPAENSFPDGGEPRHESFEQHHPAGYPGSESAADDEMRARHWTTIGDGARRPRTSDRDEVNAPEIARTAPGDPAGSAPWFGVDGTTPEDGGVESGPAHLGGMRPGAAEDMPVGWPAPGPFGARPPHLRPQAEPAPGAGMEGLLGGPGRDIRPHRAGRRDLPPPAVGKESRGPVPGTDQPRRRPRVLRLAALMLAVIVLLGGAVAGVASFTDYADGLKSALRSGAGPAETRTVTAALGDRTTATFDVVTGATRVTMRSADLGDDLYRITSAEDSGTVPYPTVKDDRVQLYLTPDGDDASGDVEVILSAKVRWALRFTGGTEEQIVDFADGAISAVEFLGAARRIELNLPDAAGTVGVRLNGAVDDFTIKAPQANPVRVRVGGGAKTVAAGERTLRDVKPGSTLTPRNWRTADRYDVAAAARVTLLSVRNAD